MPLIGLLNYLSIPLQDGSVEVHMWFITRDPSKPGICQIRYGRTCRQLNGNSLVHVLSFNMLKGFLEMLIIFYFCLFFFFLIFAVGLLYVHFEKKIHRTSLRGGVKLMSTFIPQLDRGGLTWQGVCSEALEAFTAIFILWAIGRRFQQLHYTWNVPSSCR